MLLLRIDFAELGSNTLEIIILLLVTAIIAYFIGRLGRVPRSEYDELRGEYDDAKKKTAELEESKQKLLKLLESTEKEKKLAESKSYQLGVKVRDFEEQLQKLDEELKRCREKTADVKQSDKQETLERIKAKAADIDFARIGTAKFENRDPLQKIKGIGPFIEQKLYALGIYTFRQIANFSPEDEEMVNKAIEFFPGRIKRDRWKEQAAGLIPQE